MFVPMYIIIIALNVISALLYIMAGFALREDDGGVFFTSMFIAIVLNFIVYYL